MGDPFDVDNNLLIRLAKTMDKDLELFGKNYDLATDKDNFIASIGKFIKYRRDNLGMYNRVLRTLGVSSDDISDAEFYVMTHVKQTAAQKKDFRRVRSMVLLIIQRFVDSFAPSDSRLGEYLEVVRRIEGPDSTIGVRTPQDVLRAKKMLPPSGVKFVPPSKSQPVSQKSKPKHVNLFAEFTQDSQESADFSDSESQFSEDVLTGKPAKKRGYTRAADWTVDEENKLSNCYKDNREILNAEFKGPGSKCGSGNVTRDTVRKTWEEVAKKVSAIGVEKRTGDQCRRKWTGIRRTALAKHNENGRGTGGGEGKKLTDAEAIVLEDLNEHASDLVDGNPGGYETSIPLELDSELTEQTEVVVYQQPDGQYLNLSGQPVTLQALGIDVTQGVDVTTVAETQVSDLPEEGASSLAPRPGETVTIVTDHETNLAAREFQLPRKEKIVPDFLQDNIVGDLSEETRAIVKHALQPLPKKNIAADGRPLGFVEKAYFQAATDVARLKRVKLQLEIEMLMGEVKRTRQSNTDNN